MLSVTATSPISFVRDLKTFTPLRTISHFSQLPTTMENLFQLTFNNAYIPLRSLYYREFMLRHTYAIFNTMVCTNLIYLPCTNSNLAYYSLTMSILPPSLPREGLINRKEHLFS